MTILGLNPNCPNAARWERTKARLTLRGVIVEANAAQLQQVKAGVAAVVAKMAVSP